MFFIVLRGWGLAFHPFLFPLVSALALGLIAQNTAVGVVLGLMQVVIGYANYWFGWGSFAAFVGIEEMLGGLS